MFVILCPSVFGDISLYTQHGIIVCFCMRCTYYHCCIVVMSSTFTWHCYGKGWWYVFNVKWDRRKKNNFKLEPLNNFTQVEAYTDYFLLTNIVFNSTNNIMEIKTTSIEITLRFLYPLESFILHSWYAILRIWIHISITFVIEANSELCGVLQTKGKFQFNIEKLDWNCFVSDFVLYL